MPADFFDSSVILYSLDSANPRKQEIAFRLIQRGLREASASISFQVVQEVLNGLTRRVTPKMSADDIDLFADQILIPLWQVMPTRALYRRALGLHRRYGYSFYDSLIIAAALEGGCTHLLTEDLQQGETVESLRIENPFLGA